MRSFYYFIFPMLLRWASWWVTTAWVEWMRQVSLLVDQSQRALTTILLFVQSRVGVLSRSMVRNTSRFCHLKLAWWRWKFAVKLTFTPSSFNSSRNVRPIKLYRMIHRIINNTYVWFLKNVKNWKCFKAVVLEGLRELFSTIGMTGIVR